MSNNSLYRVNPKGLALLILAAILAVWLGIRISLVDYERTTSTALETQLLETNQLATENLQAWLDKNFEIASALASNQRLVAGTMHLKTRPKLARDLNIGVTAFGLRGMLGWETDHQQLEGYFVLDETGLALASRRPEDTGLPAPVAFDPGFLSAIWAGQKAYTAELSSNAPEADPDSSACEIHPAFYFGTPVLDSFGKVIAVFILQINPQKELYPVLAAHAFGNSGETYLIDKEGRQISPSRFTLVSSVSNGCFYEDAHLMKEAFVPVPSGEPVEYTQAVTQLLLGKSGSSLVSYPDYRGIDVVGTWTKTGAYDIGIVTEQDEEEAFEALSIFKNQLVIVGISISALLIALSYAVLGNAKATEANAQSGWLIENMSEGAFVLDQDGQFTQVNDSLSEFLGIPKAELSGQSIASLGPSLQEGARQASKLKGSKGPSKKVISKRVKFDVEGETKILDFSFSPLYTSGGSDVGGIVIDATAEEETKTKLEQAKQVAEDTLAARTAFLQMVGHELRTPLNAVLGPLSIASVTDDPVQRRAMITVAEKSANDLTDTVSALEDFIAFEAGQTQPEFEKTNLKELLELATIEAVNQSDAPCDVPIKFEAGTPKTAHCEPRIIKWVVKEIVTNALQHANPAGDEERSVQINVSLDRSGTEEHISIAISDNGQGIADEEVTSALQPFTRLGQLNTGKTRGLGIGLALAKRYAELLKGNLSYEHAQSGGASFIIALPLKPV